MTEQTPHVITAFSAAIHGSVMVSASFPKQIPVWFSPTAAKKGLWGYDLGGCRGGGGCPEDDLLPTAAT